jgi:nickel/cobalt exporter
MKKLFWLSCFFGVLFVHDAMAASFWTEGAVFIQKTQQSFYRELADLIRNVKNGGWAAQLSLIGVSFLYGVFHAAGPGHGKIVISTFLASQQTHLKYGVLIAVSASFVQGLVAVALVYGLASILGWTKREVHQLVPILEQASYALIAVFGIFMIWCSLLKALSHIRSLKQKRNEVLTGLFVSSDRGTEKNDVLCLNCGIGQLSFRLSRGAQKSLRDSLSLILAVGLRPCSGAVLVLVFAQVVHLAAIGIVSVFVMSMGTALTVSFLAIISVYFRKSAFYLFEKQNSSAVEILSFVLPVLGGVVISIFGVLLFLTARNLSHPLF